MIALVPHSDSDPCERVEITVDAIVGAETITVERQWDGSTEVVRKARRADMASPFYVVDFEVPLDTDVTYVATGFSSLGAVVEVLSASTHVDAVIEPSWVVLQSPLAPKTAMRVVMAGGSLDKIKRSRSVDLAYAIGASMPYAAAGPLRAPEIELTFFTHNDAESGALLSLLSRSGPTLLRSVWPVPLPRLAYFAGEVEEVPIDAASAPDPVSRNWSAWRVTATLSIAPAAGIAVPQWTYDDVKAMYAGKTYDEVKATRPGATYLDWVRDPRP